MLDAVELEFIAWSKNRVSKELVEEHVRYMLVRKQELNHKAVPLFLFICSTFFFKES